MIEVAIVLVPAAVVIMGTLFFCLYADPLDEDPEGEYVVRIHHDAYGWVHTVKRGDIVGYSGCSPWEWSARAAAKRHIRWDKRMRAKARRASVVRYR